MADISHFGTVVTISASNTFPAPIPLTAFPRDTDPFDIPELEIAKAELGTNGNMVTWSTPNPVEITLNIIPNTPDHISLGVIFEQNRLQKGKKSAYDKITLVRVMPDGSTLTLSDGKMTSGAPAASLTSDGKIKTPSYKFIFGKMVVTPSVNILR